MRRGGRFTRPMRRLPGGTGCGEGPGGRGRGIVPSAERHQAPRAVHSPERLGGAAGSGAGDEVRRTGRQRACTRRGGRFTRPQRLGGSGGTLWRGKWEGGHRATGGGATSGAEGDSLARSAWGARGASAAGERDGGPQSPPYKMERETGFEPATSTLARSHSTTELFPLSSAPARAGGGEKYQRPPGPSRAVPARRVGSEAHGRPP